jgi:hypothetical protein
MFGRRDSHPMLLRNLEIQQGDREILEQVAHR